MAGTYTYDQVADRIAAVLGTRPSLSLLRAAVAEDARTSQPQGMPRITAGMPRPAARDGRRVVFSATQIEQWLRDHPRRQAQAAYDELIAQVSAGADTADAVGRARNAGLSWDQITQALNQATGHRRSRAAVYKTFHAQI